MIIFGYFWYSDVKFDLYELKWHFEINKILYTLEKLNNKKLLFGQFFIPRKIWLFPNKNNCFSTPTSPNALTKRPEPFRRLLISLQKIRKKFPLLILLKKIRKKFSLLISLKKIWKKFPLLISLQKNRKKFLLMISL